jgi:uncharacterized OsmC-like protein
VLVKVTGALTGPTALDMRSRQHRVSVDEPGALGGEDAAPGPVDYALVALASCQAISYRFWAEKLGIALDDVDVEVEADLDLRGFLGFDEAVRPGFTAVRVEITPKGPESAERYQELADRVDEHCPVLDLFANATPIERRVGVAAV